MITLSFIFIISIIYVGCPPTSDSSSTSSTQKSGPSLSDARACYKSLASGEDLYIAVSQHESFKNAPPFLKISVSLTLTTTNFENHRNSANYYVVLVNRTCQSTIKFSVQPNRIRYFNIKANFQVGYSQSSIASFDFSLTKDYIPRLYLVADTRKIIFLFVQFTANGEMIQVRDYVSFDVVRRNLQLSLYNKSEICFVEEFNIGQIVPVFLNRAITTLPFHSISLRVFSEGFPEFLVELPAWSCDSGSVEDIQRRKLVLSDAILQPTTLYTFNDFTESHADPMEYSLIDLALKETFTASNFDIIVSTQHDKSVNNQIYLYLIPLTVSQRWCNDFGTLFLYKMENNSENVMALKEKLNFHDNYSWYEFLRAPFTDYNACPFIP